MKRRRFPYHWSLALPVSRFFLSLIIIIIEAAKTDLIHWTFCIEILKALSDTFIQFSWDSFLPLLYSWLYLIYLETTHTYIISQFSGPSEFTATISNNHERCESRRYFGDNHNADGQSTQSSHCQHRGRISGELFAQPNWTVSSFRDVNGNATTDWAL